MSEERRGQLVQALADGAEAPRLAVEFDAGIRRDFGRAKDAFEGLAGWLAGLEEGLRFSPESRGQVRNWRNQLAELARQADGEANGASRKLVGTDAPPIEQQTNEAHLEIVRKAKEDAA